MKLNLFILFIIFSLIFAGRNIFCSDYEITHVTIEDSSAKYNYTVKVQYPQIKGYANKQTENDFNKYVREFVTAYIDTFKNEMKTWENPGIDASSDYEIVDTIYYRTNDVISILLDGYTYFTGAAHPNTFFYSINYDLKNNKVIKLPSLFKDDYLKVISKYCINDLEKQMKDYSPDIDYRWIKDGAGPKKENYRVFNFTDKEFIVTFQAYQVAAYVAGPQEVVIPLSVLSDVIKSDGPLIK